MLEMEEEAESVRSNLEFELLCGREELSAVRQRARQMVHDKDEELEVCRKLLQKEVEGQKQAAEAATAEAAQRGETAASEAVAAERRHGEAQSRELAISRADLHAQQEHIQAELLELLQQATKRCLALGGALAADGLLELLATLFDGFAVPLLALLAEALAAAREMAQAYTIAPLPLLRVR